MRLIHAVRELDRERGLGLETVALHTDADRDTRFVREADDAVAIGPATSMDDRRLKQALADYLTAPEQAAVHAAAAADRPLLVTLLWSAKESALKALRTGLRLDPAGWPRHRPGVSTAGGALTPAWWSPWSRRHPRPPAGRPIGGGYRLPS